MFEDILTKIYYNTSNPASFCGVEKLFKEAYKLNPLITHKQVKDWLSGELVYTLHKPVRKRFQRNPVVSERINECFQADLVDLKEFAKSNSNHPFILTVIDVFSKKAWAKALKNKTALTVTKAIEEIFRDNRPMKLQTDRGKEFENREFKGLMDKYRVNHFTTNNSDIKCSVVERFNRTLKNKMFRFFTKTGKRQYINVLEDLISSYNNTFHSTIGMTPNQVTEDNEGEVFEKIYGFKNKREMLRKLKSPNIKIGDNVRKKYDFKPLDRGYYPNWTDQVFKIDKTLRNYNKPLYNINDQKNKSHNRRFYPEEVQKIKENIIYRVEKILKERTKGKKKFYLVKWLNHPTTENSWEPSENIFNLNDGQ